MKITFQVKNDIPPKKDGSKSMWNKPQERPHIKALRREALNAMQGYDLCTSDGRLRLTVFARRTDGDLANFIGGVCDGLMAAKADVDDPQWADLPSGAHPKQPIAYKDDSCLKRIEASLILLENSEPFYDVELEWID